MKNPRRKFIIVFLSIIFGFFLIGNLKDLTRELIIIPLSYVLWIGQLLISSINQKVVWVAAIIVSSLVTLIYLFKIKPIPIPPSPLQITDVSAIDQWTKKLSRIDDGLYFEWRILEDLLKLTNDVIALRVGSAKPDIGSRIHVQSQIASNNLNEYINIVQELKTLLEDHKFDSKYKNTNFTLADVNNLIISLENRLEL